MVPKETELETLSRLIRRRRMIKPVDMNPSRPVDGDLVLTLLENANWAPTHGMTEPWRFQVFQGEARNELSGVMQRVYRDSTPAAEFREDKLRKMSENPLRAPVVIALCMARRGGKKIPEIEEIEATACAAQNFLLSAAAAGLAAYWSTPPLLETREFAGFLELDRDDRCLGLLYLGWPRDDWRSPAATRGPVDEKIRWRD